MKLTKLKEVMPFQWRLSHKSKDKKWAFLVAYIDSRQVRDVLDGIVGAQNWQSDFKSFDGNLYAGIGIKCNSEWVWKWDCGALVERNNQTDEEAVMKTKGQASDAFKRAGVQWGIGRFLYDLDIVLISATDYDRLKYKKKELNALCKSKSNTNSSSTKNDRPPASTRPTAPSPKQKEHIRNVCDLFNLDLNDRQAIDETKYAKAVWALLGDKWPDSEADETTIINKLNAKDFIQGESK